MNNYGRWEDRTPDILGVNQTLVPAELSARVATIGIEPMTERIWAVCSTYWAMSPLLKTILSSGEKKVKRYQRHFLWKHWFIRSGVDKKIIRQVNDAIKLNTTEKELHHLYYPFRTIPAMKIAKLQYQKIWKAQYKGIGSYMIYLAAEIVNANSAARFLTVDADIEHDDSILVFYQKNSFVRNVELYNKHRKTISMRRDVVV